MQTVTKLESLWMKKVWIKKNIQLKAPNMQPWSDSSLIYI